MAIRREHHGNFDALIAESSNTAGPFSFNRGLAFELETELASIYAKSVLLDGTAA